MVVSVTKAENMKYPLTLQAKLGMWQLFIARKADPAFRAFAMKVLARDDYTCQFCGFRAKVYQEVVNLDNDYRHNKISNLVTSCYFCAQCLFIESVGVGEYGGGWARDQGVGAADEAGFFVGVGSHEWGSGVADRGACGAADDGAGGGDLADAAVSDEAGAVYVAGVD